MTKNPSSLFLICCDRVLPLLEKLARKTESTFLAAHISENLGSFIAEELLNRAIENENKFYFSNIIWKNEWKILLTKKIRYASISWDNEVIRCLKSEHLRFIRVVICTDFNVSLFAKIPSTVYSVVFELDRIMSEGNEPRSWLPEAEEMLRSLCYINKKVPEPHTGVILAEVDLECVPATSVDLQKILLTSPGLRNLRHYQMVKALYDLHVDAFKNKEKLPIYKLKNLDVDFSHVIRCRMSPEWHLAPDALQLATILCPNAVEIHLRFDCSTPNDVLGPLLNLNKIKKFSAVCVTSGERVNLDFSDMAPIFEKFGPTTLTFLELKVIEEVEVHIIIEWCTKVETLILSGCGYVTPPTCPSYNCHTYKPGSLTKLRHLFFADGDDFSWDHGAPECFWKATLLPPVSGLKPSVAIEGLFLEFPRIPEDLTAEIFRRTENSTLPFPELRVVSFCRYNELKMADIVSMCGLEKNLHPPIYFLRLSECDQWEPEQEKQLRNWFKLKNIDCQIFVDGTPTDGSEQRRPYSFKIGRPR